ncbi:MAG: type phosphodiesterase/nucleotide pyrophosphatase [Gemmatimonadetes bacterium]|nr:type phosphodiesterase/nucleotide pyrophosphatase [Gemmatimonadota bacterium]
MRRQRLSARACPAASAPLSFDNAVAWSIVPVVVLLADGARADAFSGDLGEHPALRRLRDEAGVHELTSVFPSVTGPAYTPFLLGRFPGAVGLPGLRWYDRARTACSWPDYARSYVGWQMARVDSDIDPTAPTIFELVPRSVGGMSMITRGLSAERQVGGLTVASAARAALTHFRGRPERWLDVDREVGEEIVRRVRDERPDYVFAALTGVDKASHSRGHGSALAGDALRIVDDVVGRLRDDAERGGRWEDMHLWVVSDHGHSAVHTHEDLAGVIAAAGHRVMTHPWSIGLAPDVAVMVSGNAMAHLYVELDVRERPWWPALARRWEPLAELLLARPAVDLVLLPHSATRCEVRSALRGAAIVERDGRCFRYRRGSGDPLGLGRDLGGEADAVHEGTSGSDYPDAIVQILALAGSARAGDMILSAAPGWDFRAKYEPIPHRSAHGALHRDHMLVPLLLNRRPVRPPRRTTDLFASALAALGVAAPAMMDGLSFL